MTRRMLECRVTSFRLAQALSADGHDDIRIPDSIQRLFAVCADDVDDFDLLGEQQAKAQGLLGHAVPARHGNDHQRLLHVGQVERGHLDDLAVDPPVVLLDDHHQHDQRGHQQRDHPRTGGELGGQNDEGGDAGGDRASAVDKHVPETALMFALQLLPVDDHAGLGEGEGEEGADGVERDDVVDIAAELDEDDCRQNCEGIYPVGVQQTASAQDEDVRQEIVQGNGAGDSREVGEGSVGAQSEGKEDGPHGEVEEPTASEDSHDDEAEQALVVMVGRLHRHNSVLLGKPCCAEEHDDEGAHDDGERHLRVLHPGIAEGHHAVGDRLDAGHRSAAVGEGLEREPDAEVADGGGQCVRHLRAGDGVATRHNYAEDAEGHGRQYGPDKQKGGKDEGRAGVLDAAHVDQGKKRQHEQAQHQHVRLQPLLVADDCPDPGRDANRGGQDVVDHQRRRGKQTCPGAQVLGGDGVRAAAGGIRRNGLAIAEEDDAQQNEDDRDDGNQVSDAGDAQRNQQRERCLRSVRRRSQRIQAKDGNPGGHADVLGAFFAGGQGPAKQGIG